MFTFRNTSEDVPPVAVRINHYRNCFTTVKGNQNLSTRLALARHFNITRL